VLADLLEDAPAVVPEALEAGELRLGRDARGSRGVDQRPAVGENGVGGRGARVGRGAGGRARL
jgi:hypothetical protein